MMNAKNPDEEFSSKNVSFDNQKIYKILTERENCAFN